MTSGSDDDSDGVSILCQDISKTVIVDGVGAPR